MIEFIYERRRRSLDEKVGWREEEGVYIEDSAQRWETREVR